MFADPVRERFTSMVRLPDEDIDLAAACFLIAQEEDPEVSVLAGVRTIDAIADPLLGVIDEDTPFFHAVHALNYRLFECEGFEGDTEEYDDPQNALLHRVLSRRRGLPITLSILYMEVGRRLGLDIQGVAFPGHFLVRIKDEWGECFVDPFHKGRVRLRSQLQKRLLRTMGAEQGRSPAHFETVSPRRILVRLLSNLKRMCLRRSEIEAALRASERIVILLPEHLEERRDRGLLYRQTGHAEAAIADLSEYLDAAPDAPDAPRVRQVLVQLLSSRAAEG
jgi:regulator of sirC expression with transglutaminase-like and TPR domain